MRHSEPFIVAIAATLLIAVLTVVGLLAARPPRGSKPTVTLWQYRGHDMLRYDCGGEVSVCHSPECRKCLQVYD